MLGLQKPQKILKLERLGTIWLDEAQCNNLSASLHKPTSTTSRFITQSRQRGKNICTNLPRYVENDIPWKIRTTGMLQGDSRLLRSLEDLASSSVHKNDAVLKQPSEKLIILDKKWTFTLTALPKFRQWAGYLISIGCNSGIQCH